MSIAITAAKGRGDALDHILLYGPPGLGKTTLAYIIAAEMGVNIRVTSGPAVEQYMVQRITPAFGSGDGYTQIFLDLFLPDEVVKAPGAEAGVMRYIFSTRFTGYNAFYF